MGTSLARILLLALTVAVCGCAPVISNLEVATRTQGQPVPVDADIKPWLTNVGTPELAVGPYPPPSGPYQDTAQMANTTGNHYQGTLTGLAYGAYELKLTVPYSVFALFGTANRTRTAFKKFHVDAPAACFAFDGGTAAGAAGWTFDGIYDGDTQTQIATCQAGTLANFPFWSDQTNWSEPSIGGSPIDSRGSAWVFMSGGCFPTNPGAAQSGSWRFDYVSPDLEANADWQGIGGYQFRFVTNVAGLTLQPLLRIRKADNSVVFWRPVDNVGNPIFHPISDLGQWQEISFTFSLPAGSTILNAIVRVFGDIPQTSLAAEGAIHLDGVCPLP